MTSNGVVHLRYSFILDGGGESGIRTHVRVSPKHAFQACAFSHSAISPAQVAGSTAARVSAGAEKTRSISPRATSSLILWADGSNCKETTDECVASYQFLWLLVFFVPMQVLGQVILV